MAVYFIYGELSGYVKIGSATNPLARLRSLQTGSAEGLLLVHTMPGGRREETVLHRRFARLRVRGEWFRPDRTLALLCNVPVHEDFGSYVFPICRPTPISRRPIAKLAYRAFRAVEASVFDVVVSQYPSWVPAWAVSELSGVSLANVEITIRWMRSRYPVRVIEIERLHDPKGHRYRLADHTPEALELVNGAHRDIA